MSLVPPDPTSPIFERTQQLTPLTTRGKPWRLRVWAGPFFMGPLSLCRWEFRLTLKINAKMLPCACRCCCGPMLPRHVVELIEVLWLCFVQSEDFWFCFICVPLVLNWPIRPLCSTKNELFQICLVFASTNIPEKWFNINSLFRETKTQLFTVFRFYEHSLKKKTVRNSVMKMSELKNNSWDEFAR